MFDNRVIPWWDLSQASKNSLQQTGKNPEDTEAGESIPQTVAVCHSVYISLSRKGKFVVFVMIWLIISMKYVFEGVISSLFHVKEEKD